MKYLKALLIAVPILILVGLFIFFSEPEEKVVGNKKIIDEIIRLDELASEKNLTKQDLATLRSMVEHDPTALSYIESVESLSEYKPLHVSHSMGFLFNYVMTGDDKPCIPHEVQHLGVFVEDLDEREIAKTVQRINQNYDEWYNEARTYYSRDLTRLDEVATQSKYIVKEVQEGNRSIELTKLAQYIGGLGYC